MQILCGCKIFYKANTNEKLTIYKFTYLSYSNQWLEAARKADA